AGFRAVRLEPQATAEIRVAVPRRAFAHWDHGWAWEPGEFELAIARSAGDPGEVARVTIQEDGR
ncbi:fibronectin type III-like domain-contianing protein, partial [Amycolatopsis mediterranei]